jgi:sulfite exporter TauE/SafE
LICLAAIYIALIAFLSLNLHGGQLTGSIEKLNSLIIVALLIAVGLRIVQKSKITAVLTIVADVILIWLAVETVIVESLWDTLKNFFVEPGITLALVCILLLAWDWANRIEKIKLQTGNKV